MASAYSNTGSGERRAILSLAEWYRRHDLPIEEDLYAALHALAVQTQDARAATRAMALVLDRLDPAPTAGGVSDGDAVRPVQIAIVVPAAQPAVSDGDDRAGAGPAPQRLSIRVDGRHGNGHANGSPHP